MDAAAVAKAAAQAHFKKAMLSLLLSGAARRLHQALRQWTSVAHEAHKAALREDHAHRVRHLHKTHEEVVTTCHT